MDAIRFDRRVMIGGVLLAAVGCAKTPAKPTAKRTKIPMGTGILVGENTVGGLEKPGDKPGSNTGKALVELGTAPATTEGRLLVVYEYDDPDPKKKTGGWVSFDVGPLGQGEGELSVPGDSMGIFSRFTWRGAAIGVPAFVAGWVTADKPLHKVTTVFFPKGTAPTEGVQPAGSRPLVHNAVVGLLGAGQSLVEFGDDPRSGSAVVLYGKTAGPGWQTAVLTDWFVMTAKYDAANKTLRLIDPANGEVVTDSGTLQIATRDPTTAQAMIYEGATTFRARLLTIFLPST